MTKREESNNENRLMWAFVEGELYWTYTKMDYEEWINETFNYKINPDRLIRGHITKDKKDSGVADIIAYIGGFEQIQLTQKQSYMLIWLVNMYYYFDKLHLYTYKTLRNRAGELEDSLEGILILDYADDIEKVEYVSLYNMIMYEDFLKRLLSRKPEMLSEYREIVNEHKVVIEHIKNYSHKLDYNSSTMKNINIFRKVLEG